MLSNPRKVKVYVTPEGFSCPNCGEAAVIVPLDNSFDYSGTHCTYGKAGTHYPPGYGTAVTECCEEEVEAEIDEEATSGVF